MSSQRKEVALVTGASSGIGAEIARQLAARGADVILSARRQDRLEALAAALRSAHGIRADVIEGDLSAADGAQQLYRRARALRGDITVLVNNAGFGRRSPVLEQSLDEVRAIIQVNVTALTDLTRLGAADMKSAGYGRILQLSSIGAFQPTPMYAVYSAAKAYVLSLSYALNDELRGTGVSVTTICPGVTETEFHDVAGHPKTAIMKRASMTAPRVAAIALGAMWRRKPMVVPGLLNQVNSFIMELLPRRLSAAIAGALMRQ
jgi:hypothetical protein